MTDHLERVSGRCFEDEEWHLAVVSEARQAETSAALAYREAVRDARAAGISVIRIAAAVGVSRVAIYKTLGKPASWSSGPV